MTLNERIQVFYDQSTPLWLDVWGEHMHHGYYGKDGKERKDHRQAQVDMIKEVLEWGGLEVGSTKSEVRKILDLGCGVGGSSRLLAQLFNAEVLGLTLSPVQATNAEKYTQQAGLQGQVNFRVQDMMTLNESDGPFDLIWSMESAEHIADKAGLLHLFYKLLKPGGKFLMVTWCHRDMPPNFSGAEQKLLQQVCKLYHLPPWISISDYENITNKNGFIQVKTEDWSQAVSPFWNAVVRSAFTWQGVKGLLQAGWSTIKGAYAMRYMQAGFRRGIIKYGVVQGSKPDAANKEG